MLLSWWIYVRVRLGAKTYTEFSDMEGWVKLQKSWQCAEFETLTNFQDFRDSFSKPAITRIVSHSKNIRLEIQTVSEHIFSSSLLSLYPPSHLPSTILSLLTDEGDGITRVPAQVGQPIRVELRLVAWHSLTDFCLAMGLNQSRWLLLWPR